MKYLSLLLFTFFILLAFMPQAFTVFDPYKQNLINILAPANNLHVLGCDWLGRDLLARLIYATKDTLLIGLLTSLLAIVASLILCIPVIFKSKNRFYIFSSILDILEAFPPLLLAILLASLFEGSQLSVILALFFGSLASTTRLVLAYILEIKDREFVLVAMALGATKKRVFLKHILPNLITPIVSLYLILCGNIILAESTLSFLGLGSIDSLSWGNMVFGGKQYLSSNIGLSLYPASLILLVVLSLHGLRLFFNSKD